MSCEERKVGRETTTFYAAGKVRYWEILKVKNMVVFGIRQGKSILKCHSGKYIL
jgi:hypothetical protein